MSDMTIRGVSVKHLVPLLLGMFLTIGLFTDIRPLGRENPLNTLVLFGPALLAVAAARIARGDGVPLRSFRRTARLGWLLLIVGIAPMLLVGLFENGPRGEGAGMIATILFLLTGLPGLALILIGGVGLLRERRRGRPTSSEADRPPEEPSLLSESKDHTAS